MIAVDTRFNYPAIYVVVVNNGAGPQIVFENPAGYFSQTLNLPVTTLMGAYLRLEYSATLGTWTARYRQALTASWLSFSAVGLGSTYGGSIPAANMRAGFVSENWSGKRGYHYFTYLAMGDNACRNAGCARVVPFGATTAVISGLTPAATYTAVAAGTSQYGTGANTPVSNAVALPAAPTPLPVPVFNVALGKPSFAISTWCAAAGNCGYVYLGAFHTIH